MDRITKTGLSTLLFLLVACSPKTAVSDGEILPLPETCSYGEAEPFVLDSHAAVVPEDATLREVAELFSRQLERQTGISLQVKDQAGKKAIILSIGPGEAEQYSLSVTPERISVRGSSPEAVYRGLTSLRQKAGVPAERKVCVPSMEIQDAPAYSWRGLSLDVSRHFFTKEEVCKVIDMMTLYKLNVLHIHLTDNQGWRIEVPGYPALTDGKDRYSEQDFSEITAYAAGRFVTVVPEIDIPGHTQAVFEAYPEFPNAASSPLPFELPGQAIACLDPDDAPTMDFVSKVIDLLCRIAPGEYVHIGGDETFGMEEGKYARFVSAAKEMVRFHGKKVVGWQEMARAGVDAHDYVQHWIRFSSKQQQSQDNPAAAAIPAEIRALLGATYTKAPADLQKAEEAGAELILSPNAWAYLDCPFEETSTDPSQNEIRQRLGLQSYAPQSLTDLYDWNPASLYKDYDVAGVEAAVWCETVTSDEDLELLLLPRLPGVAEKAWSTTGSVAAEDYLRRLGSQAAIWERMGWNYYKADTVF